MLFDSLRGQSTSPAPSSSLASPSGKKNPSISPPLFRKLHRLTGVITAPPLPSTIHAEGHRLLYGTSICCLKLSAFKRSIKLNKKPLHFQSVCFSKEDKMQQKYSKTLRTSLCSAQSASYCMYTVSKALKREPFLLILT